MDIAKPHPLLSGILRNAGIEWSSVLNVKQWQSLFAKNQIPEELTKDVDFLKTWLSEGHHAGMQFLGNNIQARENLNLILPDTKSILSVIIPYAAGERTRGKKTSAGQPADADVLLNKTARYARVPDYHKAIRRELDAALSLWETEAEAAGLITHKISRRVVTDSLPFLDRAHARIAQLGFIGKNTMLIRPGTGSYFFISHVLLTAPFEAVADPAGSKPPAADAISELSCGDCTRCLDACPTQALIAPRHLDANKCLSYLSIEHRDPVAEKYLPHFSDRFYGCDICQEVCPYNLVTLPLATIRPFQTTVASLGQITAADVASMTQARYEEWFGGSAMTRAKYAGLVRNALYSLYAEKNILWKSICNARAQDPHPLIQKTAEQLLALSNE
ncbi:MAG: tRNA epoxyqueuosine(34) reductase QueG [Proteobacteria bacterium]|nr:tRNA epoxyqueuosine(34) reductase QueG [Pseudomonadota bacterium]